MGEVLVPGGTAIVVIVAVVEAAKRAGLDSKLAPFLAIVLGVATTLAAQIERAVPWVHGWVEAVGAGVILGLSASGLYSASKAMIVRRGGGGGKFIETPEGNVIDTTAHIAQGAPTPPAEIPPTTTGTKPPPMIGPGGGLWT